MTTARRVRRIIRKVDPWTVFKVSALLWLVGGIAVFLGLVMSWSVIDAAGIPDRVGGFLVDITLVEESSNPFTNGALFLRVAALAILGAVVVATALTTIAAVLYNLITDIVGGVEIVILEETFAVPGGVFPPPGRIHSGIEVPTEETAPVTRGG